MVVLCLLLCVYPWRFASKDTLCTLSTVSKYCESLSSVHSPQSLVRKISLYCHGDICCIRTICLFNFRHLCSYWRFKIVPTVAPAESENQSLFLKAPINFRVMLAMVLFSSLWLVHRKQMSAGGHFIFVPMADVPPFRQFATLWLFTWSGVFSVLLIVRLD